MEDTSLLTYPQSDVATNIMTDTSSNAVGAVLQQKSTVLGDPLLCFQTLRDQIQHLCL